MLFITQFLEHDQAGLFGKLSLVLVMWLVVLAAIAIDLAAGVRKARALRVARTSFGFRRTVSKAIQYYSVLAFALLFDIIASLVAGLPYFTMLASAFLVFIEARSVYEKADGKLRKQTAENLGHLITLLDNREDILKALSVILKEERDGKGTEKQ